MGEYAFDTFQPRHWPLATRTCHSKPNTPSTRFSSAIGHSPLAPATRIACGSAPLRTTPSAYAPGSACSPGLPRQLEPRGTAVTRKPRRWPRSPGPPASRYADRQYSAPCAQLPPRNTRLVACSGPRGFVAGSAVSSNQSAHHSQTLPARSLIPSGVFPVPDPPHRRVIPVLSVLMRKDSRRSVRAENGGLGARSCMCNPMCSPPSGGEGLGEGRCIARCLNHTIYATTCRSMVFFIAPPPNPPPSERGRECYC
jgi:hypothetical protein